jgi:hypothetical protein
MADPACYDALEEARPLSFAEILATCHAMLGRSVQLEVLGGGLTGAAVALSFAGVLDGAFELGGEAVILKVGSGLLVLSEGAISEAWGLTAGAVVVRYASGLEIELEPLD